MAKKYLIFRILFFMLFIPTVLSAQHVVTGKVTDAAEGHPLEGVYISLYEGDRLIAYTLSKSDGEFAVTVKDKKITHAIFNLLSYKPLKFLFPDSAAVPQNRLLVKLESSPLELNTIVIKPQPILIRGDTISYDADSFRRREDRTLGEVLARLPGVEIRTNGAIRVKGENIIKFYIEDMDLLGGRYGTAVNNLRADDIAYIQVYDNHQPVRALTGVEMTGRSAVNIRLKEKAKFRWLVSLEAGAGAPSFLYSAQANAMNFARSNQTIVTAKADNSGNNIIRETLIRNLKARYFRLDEVEEGISDLFNISLPRLALPDEYYYFNTSNAASLNRLNKLRSGTEIKGNIVFTTNILKNERITVRTVSPLSGPSIIIADSNRFKRNDVRISGEFTVTSNKEKKYIENVFSFKAQMDDAGKDTRGNDIRFGQKYDLPKFMLRNSFFSINNKNNGIYRFYNIIEYSRLDEKLTVRSDKINSVFGTDKAVQSIVSDNLSVDSYYAIGRKISKISFSFYPGVRVWYKNFNSDLAPSPVIGGKEIEDTNRISLFSLQPYLNSSLQWASDGMKITLNVPLCIRWDRWRGNDAFYFIYKPYFSLDYDISSAFDLKARIGVSNETGDIASLASGYIYSSYRNFYASEVISRSLERNYRVLLNYRKLESFFTAGFRIHYGADKFNRTPSEIFLEDYTFTAFIDRNRTRSEWNLGLSVQKVFGANVFTAGADLDYGTARSSQYLQENRYDYRTRTFAAALNLKWAPADYIEISYNPSLTWNRFMSNIRNTIRSFSHRAAVTVFPFRDIELHTRFSYLSETRKGYRKAGLPFWDIKATYNVTSRFSVYCKLNNILDTREYTSAYFSGVSLVSNTTRLRGIEFLCGVSLNFN